LSWNQRLAEWKEHQRILANKTDEEKEYFCVHGHWPPAVSNVKGEKQ
jgi:hypothetical protein